MIPRLHADGLPEDDDPTHPGNGTVVGIPPIGQTTSTRRPWRYMTPRVIAWPQRRA